MQPPEPVVSSQPVEQACKAEFVPSVQKAPVTLPRSTKSLHKPSLLPVVILVVVRSITAGEHTVGGFVTFRMGAGSKFNVVIIVLSHPDMVFRTEV